MPRALPVAIRLLLWQRHQQGEAAAALAAAYRVSARAIRALLCCLRRAGRAAPPLARPKERSMNNHGLTALERVRPDAGFTG